MVETLKRRINLDEITLDWTLIKVIEEETLKGKVIRYSFEVPDQETGRKIGYLACPPSLRDSLKPILESLATTIEDLRLDGNQTSFSEYLDEGVVEIYLRGTESLEDYYPAFKDSIDRVLATQAAEE